MRIVTILPFMLLGACEVTHDPKNDSSTVTLSGDAAKNGTASALDTASVAVDRASNKLDDLSNDSSSVHNGVANLSASADKLSHSVDNAMAKIDHAVDGKNRVEVKTTTTTEKK